MLIVVVSAVVVLALATASSRVYAAGPADEPKPDKAAAPVQEASKPDKPSGAEKTLPAPEVVPAPKIADPHSNYLLPQEKQKSMAVAVTLTIIPGFGAGHFYLGDKHDGVTYAVLDAAIGGAALGSFIATEVGNYATFAKVALIVMPLLWAAAKTMEVVDVVKSVEVANNRTLRPVSSEFRDVIFMAYTPELKF